MSEFAPEPAPLEVAEPSSADASAPETAESISSAMVERISSDQTAFRDGWEGNAPAEPEPSPEPEPFVAPPDDARRILQSHGFESGADLLRAITETPGTEDLLGDGDIQSVGDLERAAALVDAQRRLHDTHSGIVELATQQAIQKTFEEGEYDDPAAVAAALREHYGPEAEAAFVAAWQQDEAEWAYEEEPEPLTAEEYQQAQAAQAEAARQWQAWQEQSARLEAEQARKDAIAASVSETLAKMQGTSPELTPIVSELVHATPADQLPQSPEAMRGFIEMSYRAAAEHGAISTVAREQAEAELRIGIKTMDGRGAAPTEAEKEAWVAGRTADIARARFNVNALAEPVSEAQQEAAIQGQVGTARNASNREWSSLVSAAHDHGFTAKARNKEAREAAARTVDARETKRERTARFTASTPSQPGSGDYISDFRNWPGHDAA